MPESASIPILERIGFSEPEYVHLAFLKHLLLTGRVDEGHEASYCAACGVATDAAPIGPLQYARFAQRDVLPGSLCGTCSLMVAGGWR